MPGKKDRLGSMPRTPNQATTRVAKAHRAQMSSTGGLKPQLMYRDSYHAKGNAGRSIARKYSQGKK